MKHLITFSMLIAILVGCQQDPSREQNMTNESRTIFPRGDLGSSEFFTGKAYHYPIVPADSIFTTQSGNVYFEPGARSNWHSHPSGQILIVTDGIGYHQIEGQPSQTIEKGDVVKCPPNVRHWHGASIESGMQHIYIIPNTENGIVNWGEPVSEEQYKSTK